MGNHAPARKPYVRCASRSADVSGPTGERVETLSNHALCLRRHACHAPPTLTRLSARVSFPRLSVSRLFVAPFLLQSPSRPTGPLSSRMISSLTVFLCLSLALSLFRFFVRLSHSPSRSRVLLYRTIICMFFSLPPPFRLTSPSSLDACTLIKKKGVVFVLDERCGDLSCG